MCPEVFIPNSKMAISVNTNIKGPYSSPTTVCTKQVINNILMKMLTDYWYFKIYYLLTYLLNITNYWKGGGIILCPY